MTLGARRPLPSWLAFGLDGLTAPATLPIADAKPVALALGFNGLSAPIRPAETGGETEPMPDASPFRRMIDPRVAGKACVLPFGDIEGTLSFIRSRSSREVNSAKGADGSAPIACRRAFSCLAWTARKCEMSSCHLISSRPIFDLVDEMLGIALVHSNCISRKGTRGDW